MIVGNELDATDAGTHCNADAVPILFSDLQTGISDCINAGCNAVVDERIVFSLLLGRQVCIDVEVLHRPRNAGGISTCVKFVAHRYS